MTPRERAFKALRREKLDKVPKDFAITPQIYELIKVKRGTSNPWEYFGCEPRWVAWLPTRIKRDFSAYLGESPSRCWIDKNIQSRQEKIKLRRIGTENTVPENIIPVGGEWGTGRPPASPWIDQEWGVGYIPTASMDPQHAHLFGFVYPMRNLKTVEELKEYPFSDYESNYRHNHLEQEMGEIKRKEYFATGGMAMTIFEVAWQLRGMDNLFFDFIENEPFARYLLDYITEMRRFMIRRFTEAGADHIHLGDDMGTQQGMLMNPELWRKWFKERMRSVISVARKINPEIIISYHSDGNIEKIIPELIEIGIEVLNPVQPEAMDPAKLKRMYGDKLAFWGTVGTQTTMPFGTPEEVRSVVKERIETMGKDGGLLIAPTHALEPDVPIENILAFFEAVEEFGMKF